MLSSSVWRGSSRSWFSVGLLAGGLFTALVAVTLGSLLVRPWLGNDAARWVVMGAAGIVLARELRLVRFPLPQNARQVPEGVASAGPRLGALTFGFEMGTGLRTFMTSSLPHLLALVCVIFAAAPTALAIGLGFGAGRALMTMTRTAHPDVEAWMEVWQGGERHIQAALALGAVALVVPAIM